MARGDLPEVADCGAPAWVGCASSRGTVAVTAVSVIMIPITLAEYFIPVNVLKASRARCLPRYSNAVWNFPSAPNIVDTLARPFLWVFDTNDYVPCPSGLFFD